LIDALRNFVMGPSPIFAHLLDWLQWGQMIDDHVGRGDHKVSVGTRTNALLINIATDRKALYKVSEFYEKMDTELLFGDGVTAADLNDDALGRALDILHDADIESLYPKLALSTIEKLKIMDSFDGFIPIHSDTTSLSLYGEYPDQEDLEIVRGYSKDHRPDLKQIVFGLSTVRGVPIYGNVNKGNQDDPTWNLNTIAKLAGLVAQGDKGDVIYVADAAAVTQDNLQAFHENKTHFISRLPATFSLCEQLKRAAWEKEESAWTDLGQLTDAKDSATYKIQAFRRELYGQTYRLIVIRSSGLAALKEHKLQDVVAREAKKLDKEVQKQSKVLYSCEADAQQAADKFLRANKRCLHTLKTSIEAIQTAEKRTRKGRPRKDEPTPATITQYRIQVNMNEPGQEALGAWREKEETFVLITDIRDDQRLPDEQVLRLYKGQGEAVEAKFRYLKSPYHVGPVFLQRPSRVKAFGYLMLLSLLLYSVFEYILREQMAQETEPLILPGKRKSFRPTGASVMEMFETMVSTWASIQGQWQRMKVHPDNPQLERILGFFGLDMSIYSEVKKSA
jgi:transposase